MFNHVGDGHCDKMLMSERRFSFGKKMYRFFFADFVGEKNKVQINYLHIWKHPYKVVFTD